MAALLHQPTAFSLRRAALFPPRCARPAAAALPPAIGQRGSSAASTWTRSACEARRSLRTLLGCDGVRIAAPGSRASQQGLARPPVLAPVCARRSWLIGPRMFSSSRVCRAADGQPGGAPGDGNQTPQPKKPLLEKTKELRKQLKSLTTHEKIWNVPNVLTFSRLVAAPVVGSLILHDQHAWALGLFAYAGITDMVDGWIARRWQLQTVVGSVVDPMADKLLMAITVGCLAAKGALPGPLAILIFGRDASLAIAAIYYRYASLPSPKTFARYWDFSLPSAEVHPTTVSKFNTFLQLALIGLTLLFPVLAHSSSPNEQPKGPDAAVSSKAPPAAGMRASPAADPISAPVAAAPSPIGAATGGPASDSFTKPDQQHEPEQPSYGAALHAATDAGNLSAAVIALQVLVGATTVWSGFSYAILKDAVTILGTNEALKKRQGARGRAIIGVSFALVCVGAVAWAIRDRTKEENQHND